LIFLNYELYHSTNSNRLPYRLLLLPTSGKEQDWDIELADAIRLDEFLNVLDHQHLSDDQKHALMALIIASYDDFLGLTDSSF